MYIFGYWMYFSYVWLLTNGCFFLMFISSKYSLSSLLFSHLHPFSFPSGWSKTCSPTRRQQPNGTPTNKEGISRRSLTRHSARGNSRCTRTIRKGMYISLMGFHLLWDICRMDVVGIIWNLLARNTLVSSPDPTLSQGETVWWTKVEFVWNRLFLWDM